MMRYIVIVVFVLGLGVLFVFGLTNTSYERDIASPRLNRMVGDFRMPLFERYHEQYGTSMTLAEQHGQPLVINFWASWCGPCYEEAPELEQAWRKYGDRVLFVGVDTQETSLPAAEAFLDRFNLSFPNGLDDNSRIGIEYGLFGVPETFFVRADGTLHYRHMGPINLATLETKIEELLQ